LGKLKWAKQVVLSVSVLFAAMGGLSWFDAARAENPEVTGPPIPYDHFANQETDPFLYSGRLMDEDHPRWRQFRGPLQKYPDVRDCLVEGERESEQPNLLKIDWRGVGPGASREVCVFRIARSLKDVELIRQWLLYHQFRVGELSRVFDEDYTPRYETQRIYNMQGSWTKEQYRKIHPSWLAALTGFDPVYGHGLLFEFSEDFTVVGVGSMSSMK
jgi:hypothetical protein